MKRLKKLLSMFSPLLILLVIYGFFQVTGLRLCAVQSGSMEPEIPTYSLCLVNTRYDYDTLAEGDIVVYDRPYDHPQVIHRIIAIFDEGIITKGDANSVDDGLLLTKNDIEAEYITHIPYIGRITTMIRTPVGIGLIVICVAILLIADGIKPKKKPEEQPKSDETSETTEERKG